MKQLRVFSLVLAALAVGMMASCISSDNDGVSEEEYQKQLAQLKLEQAAMRGSYSGYIYHMTGQNNETADSTRVTWRIDNDSTMVMERVPVGYLTAQVSDSIVRTQLAAAGTVDLKVKIYYYAAISPLVYCVAPEDVDVPLIDENGTTQGQATIHFYSTADNNDAYGAFSMTSREGLLRVFPRDIYVGGAMQQRFGTNAVVVWFGKHL